MKWDNFYILLANSYAPIGHVVLPPSPGQVYLGILKRAQSLCKQECKNIKLLFVGQQL